MNAVEWIHINQSHMYTALDEIRMDLYRYLGRDDRNSVGVTMLKNSPKLDELALESLCRVFQLNEFERKLLLLCAGVQLDAEFSQLCSQVSGDSNQKFPSFDLALQIFNGGEWLPFLSSSSLRYWKLLDLHNPRQANVTSLSIEEPVLHYLTGYLNCDSSLNSLFIPMPSVRRLPPSHIELASKINDVISGHDPHCLSALVCLSGSDYEAKISIAQHAAAMRNIAIRRIDAESLPQDVQLLQDLCLKLEREALFNHCAYFFDLGVMSEMNTTALRSLLYLIKRLSAFCVISRELPNLNIGRHTIKFEVLRPAYTEQLSIWKSQLSPDMCTEKGEVHLRCILDQFNLDIEKIYSVAHQFKNLFDKSSDRLSIDQAYQTLWELCRSQCRTEVGGLVSIIEPSDLDWNSLILPFEYKDALKNMVTQVRQRYKVYREWGFADGKAYGMGVSALFSGGSGTGKTLAARVIASELGLDVYQIDLSAIVSKYIGETEKNLEKIFCSAEKSGAILLFDEADSIFGKRSQVQDSKDRYANMEVSYLLQRVESYSGLSILTSNHKSALDSAFIRRLRFIVQFPFPQIEERMRIWRCVFPRKMPTDNLDFEKLSRLEISGGMIRSIALNAAFHAAEEGDFHMKHLLRATQDEFKKHEKTLRADLIEDW